MSCEHIDHVTFGDFIMATVVYIFDKISCEIVYTRILTTSEVSMLCGTNLSSCPSHLNLESRLKSGVLLLPMSEMVKTPAGAVFDDIYSAALGIGTPKGSVLEAIYMASLWGFRASVDALLHGLSKRLPDYSKQDPIKWLMLLFIITYTHLWTVDMIYMQMVTADVCDFVCQTYGSVNFEFVLQQPFVIQRFMEIQSFAQKDDRHIASSDIEGFRFYVKNILSKINVGMLLCRGHDACSSDTSSGSVSNCVVDAISVVGTVAS